MKLLSIPLQQCNQAQFARNCKDWLRAEKQTHVATVNPEFLVASQSGEAFSEVLQSTYNIVDGIGITALSRLLYGKKLPRVTGVSAAATACAVAAEMGKSVYLYGGQGVAQKAAEWLEKEHPKLVIAGAEDGTPDAISEQLEATKPDILLVAFGAPKQEFFITKNLSNLPSVKIAMGVGGTFDFWSGSVKRAPALLQHIGLEWLWRLVLQPHRWRRIYRAVVVFPWLALHEWASSTRHH